MHNNVKILIIFLFILVALGYVIWLKNRLYPSPPAPVIPIPTVSIEPSVEITPIILNQSTSSTVASSSAVYKSSPSARINNYGN